MRILERIRSTYSTKMHLVVRTYLYVWYGPVEIYVHVGVRGTDQLKKYVLGYVS